MLANMVDEKYLIQQFTRGSHEAFRGLFMRYHLKIYHFIKGLVKSESDAEDLTQEVFLKLWTHRARFTEIESFSSYLYVLAKHTTFNYIESKQIRQEKQDKYPIDDRQEDTPHDELVAKDLQLLIDMVVDSMPQQRKRVYHLSRNLGLSNAEIAEKLQLTKKTVENHLNIALKELKNAILIFIVLSLC